MTFFIGLLYFITAVYSLFAFFTKRYVSFIVALFLIVSGGSGFLPIIDIKEQDIGMLVILFILCFSPRYLNFHGDKIGRWICYFIVYIGFICLTSVLLHLEQAKYAALLFRADLFMLSYFVFKQIKLKQVRAAFRILCLLTFITGIFYYLQFVGISGILRDSDSNVRAFNFNVARYNFPLLTSVMLFYFIFTPEKIKRRVFWVVFYGAMIVLSLGRGFLIANVMAIAIFLLLSKKMSKYRQFVVVGILLLCMASPYINYRLSSMKNSNADMLSEITLAKEFMSGEKDILNYDNGVVYNEGTGVFRALLATEKVHYLLQSPWTALFGVGAIHESSSSVNRFNFIFGAPTTINGIQTRHQIDTSDVAFLAHLTRYGFFFLLIYGIYLFYNLRLLYRQKDILFTVTFLYLLTKLFWAFGSDQFYMFSLMFFVLLVSSQIPGQLRLADKQKEDKA